MGSVVENNDFKFNREGFDVKRRNVVDRYIFVFSDWVDNDC